MMDQQRLNDQTLFAPVDAARLADQMSLASKGNARGKQNQPPPGTSLPDDVESQIIQEVTSLRAQVVQDVQLRLQAINRSIAKDRAVIGTSILDTEIAPIVTRLEQNARIDILDVEATREKLVEQREDFLDWRRKRNLKRPAKEGQRPISFFADLFLLAIAEGGLNLFFFMENSQFGMLGAFLQAFIIAAANIVLCTVAGFVLFKRMNSSLWSNKLFGIVSSLAVMALLPVAHLVVGFYRIARQEAGAAAAALPPGTPPPADAVSPLWTAIEWTRGLEFGRLDEMSLIMCAVGVILGAYAIRKGYEFGDRYPDYTKNYWSYEDRRLDYIDHLDEVTSAMINDHADASARISNFFSTLANSLTSLKDYQDRKTALATSLRNYEMQLTQVARTLLAQYRGANAAVRDQPAPRSFSVEFAFADPVFDGNKILYADLEAQLREHQGIEDDAKRAADNARLSARGYEERIQNAIKAAQAALEAGRELREAPKLEKARA